MRSSDMMGIGSSSAATNLTINLRTSFNSMFQFFKHQYTSSFTHYKSITVFVVRTRCSFWIFIPFTQSFHGVESAHTGFAHDAFGSTRNNQVSLTKSYQIECFHHGVGRRSTSTHHGEIGSTKSM